MEVAPSLISKVLKIKYVRIQITGEKRTISNTSLKQKNNKTDPI